MDSTHSDHAWADEKLRQTLRQVAALLDADASTLVTDAVDRRRVARELREWL